MFSLGYDADKESSDDAEDVKNGKGGGGGSGGSGDKGGGELKRTAGSRNKNYRSNPNLRSRDGGPPVRVSEGGVHFKSYRDGRLIYLTPESTVQAQKSLGADIIIPLDELPPYRTDRERLVESVEL